MSQHPAVGTISSEYIWIHGTDIMETVKWYSMRNVILLQLLPPNRRWNPSHLMLGCSAEPAANEPIAPAVERARPVLHKTGIHEADMLKWIKKTTKQNTCGGGTVRLLTWRVCGGRQCFWGGDKQCSLLEKTSCYQTIKPHPNPVIWISETKIWVCSLVSSINDDQRVVAEGVCELREAGRGCRIFITRDNKRAHVWYPRR